MFLMLFESNRGEASMKLNFDAPGDNELKSALVLLKSAAGERERRIEFYCKRRDGKTWVMLAFSGFTDSLPDKAKLQGPYHSIEQVHAAVSAILNVLTDEGFGTAKSTPPIWSIRAQMEVKKLRTKIGEELEGYEFDPSDVFFDTLGFDDT